MHYNIVYRYAGVMKGFLGYLRALRTVRAF